MVEERVQTTEEIRAAIEEARRKREAAQLAPKTASARRTAEVQQSKSRVNQSLLHDKDVAGRDETWTIRAKSSQIRAVKQLAERLSRPKAKVSIAALMDEAIVLLLAKYENEG